MSGIAGQAFTVVFGRGLTRAAQLVTFIVLARFLSPDEFGWYGIITTVIALAALLGGLGLRQSLAYWIGQRRMTPGEAVATALAVFVPTSAISVAAVLLLFGRDAPVNWIVLASALAVSVSCALLIGLLQGINLGRGQIAAFSFGENFPRTVLMVGALILLLLSHVNLETALWAQAIGFAVTVPILLWFAARGAGQWRVRFDALVPMTSYGGIFALNLFLLMLSARLSMFFIENSHGAAEAGRFFAAVRVNEIFLEVAAALGMVLFSNAARQESSSSVIVRNARISCWMLWLFIAGGVLVALFSPGLLLLLAGPEYTGAASALQILAIGLAPAAAAKLIYPSLAGSGKPFFGSPVIVSSLAVSGTLSAILVPPLGLNGGAIALVSGQYILFIGYVLVCRTRYGVAVRDFLLPRRADLRAIGRAIETSAQSIRKKFRRS